MPRVSLKGVLNDLTSHWSPRFSTVLYFVEKKNLYLSRQGCYIRGIIDLQQQTCLQVRVHIMIFKLVGTLYIIGGNDFNNLMTQIRKWKLNFILRQKYQINNIPRKFGMSIRTVQNSCWLQNYRWDYTRLIICLWPIINRRRRLQICWKNLHSKKSKGRKLFFCTKS